MHSAEAFIENDLHCFQGVQFTFSVNAFRGNQIHDVGTNVQLFELDLHYYSFVCSFVLGFTFIKIFLF